jgi:hypothetical protein
MAMTRSIERAIAGIEGFEVTLHYADGRNMRGDKEGLPPYGYQVAAMNDWTVAHWREQRFKQAYPGYEVKVWFAGGDEAHGRTMLSTVRATYAR